MKHFLNLSSHSKEELFTIFDIADGLKRELRRDLAGKTVVMFFPANSIRTRVTFEKGIMLLGGQCILFPSETLDKREKLEDVCEYLNNWADLIIVRHSDPARIEELAKHSAVPVINAMSAVDHPCEILSDLYALRSRRKDFTKDRYLFCGVKGNIGLAWLKASQVFGFSLSQCCPPGYELPGIPCYTDIFEAVRDVDIVCTDSLPKDALEKFAPCRVSAAAMRLAREGALLNPCPPFYRGEEVTADAIDSEFFVGYAFKDHLLEVQQAIMLFCLADGKNENRR